MKKINRAELIEKVAAACIDSNIHLSTDVCNQLNKLTETETNPRAKTILEQFAKNREIASETKLPLCQDTGIVLMQIKLGNEIHLDFDLYEALNEGIRQAYEQGHLRKSVVSDPLFRTNSGDNTPGVFHTELVMGDSLEITIAPKGAGSENMSNLKMMTPQTPIQEVEDYIYDCVVNSGGKPCPPIVVGVGIGGTFEKAALNAKAAVLEEIGAHNPKPEYEAMEKRLIERINASGIGPMGLGGKSSCLDVSIKEYPCHIASLPVAVNINCHVARHKVVKL